MASALTAQKAFVNNFGNIVNCRVDIWEDIRCYQDILSYASSKVDYSMGLGMYMLPRNMNLNIRSGTAGYNNEILVSDSGFSLERNDTVYTSTPVSHRTLIVHIPVTKAVHKEAPSKHTSTSEVLQEEKVTLELVLTGAFGIWYAFVNEGYETRWPYLSIKRLPRVRHITKVICRWSEFGQVLSYLPKVVSM